MDTVSIVRLHLTTCVPTTADGRTFSLSMLSNRRHWLSTYLRGLSVAMNGSLTLCFVLTESDNRPSMTKEHRRVKVSTGNKQILGSGSLPKEPTEIRALRKTLGYKGLPYPGTSQWFMYQGGLFRTKTSSLPPRSLSHPDAPPPPFCDQDDIHVR